MSTAPLAFESHIAAPPERVFAFHERPDAFALLTPWWSGARVVRAAASLASGPARAADPGARTAERRMGGRT